MTTLPQPNLTEPISGAHVGHATRERTNGVRSQRKPNLFVIGAMKSGSTYLNKLLGAHPAIFMCSPEEPSYFVDQKQLRALWPEAWDLGFWRDEDHYPQLFRSSGDAAVLGEETAAAARAAWSAQRRQRNSTTRTVIEDIRRSGVVTLVGIAQVLESRGVKTPAGHSTWQPGVAAVGRVD